MSWVAQLAAGAVQAVLPRIPVTLHRNIGSTADAAGYLTPAYDPPEVYGGSVQPVPTDVLRQVDGINQQGTLRAVRLFAAANASMRPMQTGGDLLEFEAAPGGLLCRWLVVHVIEAWPGWCHVVVAMQ